MNQQKHHLAQATKGDGKCMTVPRVFVVDDHPIFSEVLAELLHQSGDFVVVGSAADGAAALAKLAEVEVDVLLLDLMLPGISGLEILERLQQKRSAVRTVVYSGQASDEAVAAAFARGACAVVEKSAHVPELLGALRAVVRGEFPMNSRMSGVLRALVRQRTVSKELGEADLMILRRLASRHTAKEIAAELGLSVSAVYKARIRIMQRMGLTAPVEFFAAASSLGLVLASPDQATGSRHGRTEGTP